MMLAQTIGVIVAAYLIGAIPFGLLIARLYGVKDVRLHGSGNIGATNVWRVAGPKAAVWVYILDIGKGVAAVLGAKLFAPYWLPLEITLILVACAVVAGHVFPVYLKFHGGKGVNTALGALIVLLPIETGLTIVIFAITLTLTHYVSAGSMVAAVSLPLILAIEVVGLSRDIATPYAILAIVVAFLVLITHRQNIRRLIAGTESRFSWSSGKKEAANNG
jgi:glycerol-3-phosphate acyltransferase PlsY